MAKRSVEARKPVVQLHPVPQWKCSSMAERLLVKHRVACSNQAVSAIVLKETPKGTLLWERQEPCEFLFGTMIDLAALRE